MALQHTTRTLLTVDSPVRSPAVDNPDVFKFVTKFPDVHFHYTMTAPIIVAFNPAHVPFTIWPERFTAWRATFTVTWKGATLVGSDWTVETTGPLEMCGWQPYANASFKDNNGSGAIYFICYSKTVNTFSRDSLIHPKAVTVSAELHFMD